MTRSSHWLTSSTKKCLPENAGVEVSPTAEDVAGFNAYIENYKACLPVEEAAVKYKK